MDGEQPQAGDWNPFEALKNLTMERALESTNTPQQTAKRLFEENLPIAVMSICHIATYGESEAMRFNAARYVVERTMGPAERTSTVDGRHAWDDIYEKVVSEAEGYLNS
jgi:hypothetical protein